MISVLQLLLLETFRVCFFASFSALLGSTGHNLVCKTRSLRFKTHTGEKQACFKHMQMPTFVENWLQKWVYFDTS